MKSEYIRNASVTPRNTEYTKYDPPGAQVSDDALAQKYLLYTPPARLKLRYRSLRAYFFKFLIFFKEIVLFFISFHINFCPEWVCMTQSNTKQLPTCLDPHILVPSVIPFCIDMRGKSLSLCCSASLTKQRCKSSNDSLSVFWIGASNQIIKTTKHVFE